MEFTIRWQKQQYDANNKGSMKNIKVLFVCA